jgi:hypothetical protein
MLNGSCTQIADVHYASASVSVVRQMVPTVMDTWIINSRILLFNNNDKHLMYSGTQEDLTTLLSSQNTICLS